MPEDKAFFTSNNSCDRTSIILASYSIQSIADLKFTGPATHYVQPPTGDKMPTPFDDRYGDIIKPVIEDLAYPVEDVLNEYWVTDQQTFNYTLPCAIEDTPAVVVVVHGANRRQKVKGGLERMGTHYIYDKSVSIAYPRLTDFCVAIAIPKSGVLSPQIGARHTNYYRTWWMTQGTVDPVTLLPVFNEEEEINAIIDLIEVANEVVKKPVFLLLGNDLGRLANKVIDVLGLTGQSNAIAGFVLADRKTGEFTAYLKNGTEWESVEH